MAFSGTSIIVAEKPLCPWYLQAPSAQTWTIRYSECSTGRSGHRMVTSYNVDHEDIRPSAISDGRGTLPTMAHQARTRRPDTTQPLHRYSRHLDLLGPNCVLIVLSVHEAIGESQIKLAVLRSLQFPCLLRSGPRWHHVRYRPGKVSSRLIAVRASYCGPASPSPAISSGWMRDSAISPRSPVLARVFSWRQRCSGRRPYPSHQARRSDRSAWSADDLINAFLIARSRSPALLATSAWAWTRRPR